MSNLGHTDVSSPLVYANVPVVSVDMITYNQAPYIAEAIEGVLAQITDFPIELIVSDDCSRDGTLEIALDYQKRYPAIVRVLSSEENTGFFANSSRSFSQSRGEFVAYCEGDDYWHDPYKLQKQVNYLRNNKNCTLVHTDYDRLIYTFGAWRIIHRCNYEEAKIIPVGNVYSILLTNMFITTCTMMGRAEHLRIHYQSSFRTANNPVGDWPIVLHMAILGEIGYIDESTATYRRAKSSMTNLSGYSNYLGIHRNKYKMYRALTTVKAISDQEWGQIERSMARELVLSAFDAPSSEDFYNALVALEKYDPDYLTLWRTKIRAFLMQLPLILTIVLRVRIIIREIRFLKRSNVKTMGY